SATMTPVVGTSASSATIARPSSFARNTPNRTCGTRTARPAERCPSPSAPATACGRTTRTCRSPPGADAASRQGGEERTILPAPSYAEAGDDLVLPRPDENPAARRSDQLDQVRRVLPRKPGALPEGSPR